MKKIFTKALSVFLAALMFLTVAPAFALAADEPATPEAPAAPVFSLELVSETAEEAVVVLKLKENSFNSFDITVTTTCQGLTLSKIAFNVDLLLAGGTQSFNLDNGKSSFAITEPVVAECDIVTYTYTKATGEGAVVGDVAASEFSVDFESCAVSANDGTEANIDVTDSVVAENNLPTAHVHEPADSWVITKDATCAEEGTIVQYCTTCGKIANSSVIKKTDHKNKKTEHKDATCTEAGYDKVICTDCGEIISETTINPTNHPNTKKEHKDATCAEAGYDKETCLDCGKIISNIPIAATGHKNKKTEHKDPTCTEAGYDREICNDCGTVISTTSIKEKGHGDTEIAKQAATCTEDGYIRTVCKDCGSTMTETPLPSYGHNYIYDRKEATCTEDGYVRNFCPSCQDVKSSTALKKTGHKWLAWKVIEQPTHSKEGVERRICDNCGSHEDRSVPKLVTQPTELVMSMQDIGMNFKQTTRLFVSIYPEEAAYSTDIVWESSNEKVATVDEEGAVYAAGVGTATITAKTPDGKISATCKVTVSYSVIQWIIVYLLFGWIWYI